MNRVLTTLNLLLGVIAVCLVLIAAKLYHIDMPAAAYAQEIRQPQMVQLVYWDGYSWQPAISKTNTINAHLVYWNGSQWMPFVSRGGTVRTTK